MKISNLFFAILYSLFLCFLLFLPQTIRAQESEYDLLQALPLAQGTEKIDVLVKLSLRTNDIDKAKQWATEALALAQTATYQDGIASAYICLGNVSKYLIHSVIATDSLDGIAQKYGTTVEEIMKNSLLLSEGIFEGQTLWIVTPASRVEAENYFLKALEIRKLQKFVDGQVWAYQRLAALAKDGNDWDKAEKYYLEIIKIRENEWNVNKGEITALRYNLLSLGDFYFARYQREKAPSERNYFLQKEEETRNKFLDWVEKTTSKANFQTEMLNTVRFYWQTRKQVGRAEKYLKKAMTSFDGNSKQFLFPVATEFYKEQGKTYFNQADFEKAEQFFKSYTQATEQHFNKMDTTSYNEIANSYFLVADFYRKKGNTIGSDIYTFKGAQARLKQNNTEKLNWLKNRLTMVNPYSPLIMENKLDNEKLEFSFKDLTKELYKEDFKAILTQLPLVNNLVIKKLMVQKAVNLGAIIGENTQMIAFYADLLQSKNLDADTKLDLHLKLAKVNENQGNTAQAANHYRQIIQVAEKTDLSNNISLLYLAKAHKALNNKQKAIDYAWKALKNAAIPSQKTDKTEKVAFLSAEMRQEARDILSELLKFDEVADTTFIVHTIEKGEGLNDIQRLYDVSEICLQEWNFLENNELVEGMKIKVCKKIDWVRGRKENEALPTNTYFYHILNQGETLQSIAQRYQKTVAQIQAENNNALTHLSIGQKIWIGKYFMQCSCEE